MTVSCVSGFCALVRGAPGLDFGGVIVVASLADGLLSGAPHSSLTQPPRRDPGPPPALQVPDDLQGHRGAHGHHTRHTSEVRPRTAPPALCLPQPRPCSGSAPSTSPHLPPHCAHTRTLAHTRPPAPVIPGRGLLRSHRARRGSNAAPPSTRGPLVVALCSQTPDWTRVLLYAGPPLPLGHACDSSPR